MSSMNEEKKFSAQDVVRMAAKILGSQPQDLIEEIKEQDLSTEDSLSSFLNSFSVSSKNAQKAALKTEFDKGFRKGNQRSESEFLEVFQVEADGKTGADLFMTVKQSISKTKETSTDKTITASQAFNVKEVKQKIAALESQVKDLSKVSEDYASYKNLQAIKGKAIDVLNNAGANWSKDPSRKSRQIKALDLALQSTPHKITDDGTVIILDSDGENPLHNPATGDNWVFEDWAKAQSPVDFTTSSKKPDSDIFTPSDKGSSIQNFGFTSSEIKKFTVEDYKKVYADGEYDKAEFIKTKIYENADEGEQD